MKYIAIALTLLGLALTTVALAGGSPITVGDVYAVTAKTEISAEDAKFVERAKNWSLEKLEYDLATERGSHGTLAKVTSAEALEPHAALVESWINLFNCATLVARTKDVPDPADAERRLRKFSARLARRIAEINEWERGASFRAWAGEHVRQSLMGPYNRPNYLTQQLCRSGIAIPGHTCPVFRR